MFEERIKIKDTKVEIGKLLKGLRKREKLSQEELAKLLDLSRITIQNLESGKNFTIDTLLKVLQHFDMMHELHQFFLTKKNDIENVKSLY